MSETTRVEVEGGLARFVAEGAELERRMQSDPAFAAEQARRDAELQTAERERKRIDEELAKRRQLLARGIPLRFLTAIVAGSFSPTKALQAAIDFAMSTDRMLVLAGRPGCGKTFAAAWLTSRQVYDDYLGVPGGRWPTELVPQFVDVGEVAALPSFGPGSERLEVLRSCETLAIDDVGMEFVDGKGLWRARFDQLINARYAGNLRTLLTTNLPANEFREAYGERVSSRIRETGQYVNVDAPSLREVSR